jgi:hypothetical protein
MNKMTEERLETNLPTYLINRRTQTTFGEPILRPGTRQNPHNPLHPSHNHHSPGRTLLLTLATLTTLDLVSLTTGTELTGEEKSTRHSSGAR